MSRSATFANLFSGPLQNLRVEIDQEKASVQTKLDQARQSVEDAQKKIADLEQQISEIERSLAEELVKVAKEAGIKIDLRRAKAQVSGVQPTAEDDRQAVIKILQQRKGNWVAASRLKEQAGVDRPLSILLKSVDGVESTGKARGAMYRVA